VISEVYGEIWMRESLVYVRVCVFMEERDHLVREMSVFSSFWFSERCARAGEWETQFWNSIRSSIRLSDRVIGQMD
jgi:hypothetical protein